MFKFGSTLDAAKHGLAEERCPRIRSLDNNGIYREEILNGTGTARSWIIDFKTVQAPLLYCCATPCALVISLALSILASWLWFATSLPVFLIPDPHPADWCRLMPPYARDAAPNARQRNAVSSTHRSSLLRVGCHWRCVVWASPLHQHPKSGWGTNMYHIWFLFKIHHAGSTADLSFYCAVRQLWDWVSRDWTPISKDPWLTWGCPISKQPHRAILSWQIE